MKLGTKLSLFISLVIILVLSAYGYSQFSYQRNILTRELQLEVMSIGQTLKSSLEEISFESGREHIQHLINTLDKPGDMLGIIVYEPRRNYLFVSRSLKGNLDPFLALIRKSVDENHPREQFGSLQKIPVFVYAFPLQNRQGNVIGGAAIIHPTAFLEKEISRAKWIILLRILAILGGTVILILVVTKKSISDPIFQLIKGIDQMAKGQLDTRIDLHRRDEISEVARAFNRMAADLKAAQEKMVREAASRLELERRLLHSEKLATIGQLASGLAHEIGTPLSIISGRAELLMMKFHAEEENKNLNIILLEAARITRIIRQFLGFARKKEPERGPVRITSLLETTVDFVAPQIEKANVSVIRDLRENLPPVMGDADQLQQVFLNLLLNALQAMPSGGTLYLSAFPKALSKQGLEDCRRPFAVVSVRDTGSGMDREHMGKIFQPFFTTKEKEEGTGLGLTISQGIVQDHNGWIEVESEVGRGTEFLVYLPCLGEVDREGERN